MWGSFGSFSVWVGGGGANHLPGGTAGGKKIWDTTTDTALKLSELLKNLLSKIRE